MTSDDTTPPLLAKPEVTRPLPAWLAPLLRGFGALFALSPFLPPLLHRWGNDGLADLIDTLWSPMCHRMPERSLAIMGEQMPLCTRCLGLAAGLGLGFVVGAPYWGLRALRIWLTLACGFLFIELTTQDLGWHAVFHPTRLLSGFLVAYPVGAAATALVARLSAPEGSGAPRTEPG